MARRAAKVDSNQGEIVKALRDYGASVQLLHRVGDGCPDLLVGCRMGFRKVNLLMEVKDGDKPPSARKFTEKQEEWHALWEGQACVVTCVDEALAILESKENHDDT